MGYSNNPRKVYGRVDVIYSDSDIATDIIPHSNSLAPISHMDEVFKGHIEPTVKACTLDGNSTMNGSFQMIDDSCVIGWWSKSHCNANGNFVGTKPYLELSFVQKPIITWMILSDTKLNQYPVDFTLSYYNGDTVVKTDEIMGNDSVEIKFHAVIEDVTKIRLTIAKWSTPYACAKILKFYDRLFERYEGDAVQMFEVTEEMGTADVNYNISSDVMTVNLYNENRKFDKGYLRSLMILDRKLIPYIGIDKNDEIEYTQLGTFYSDEWQISQDSQWVKCVASDRLLRLQNKIYLGFPYNTDISLKEIAEDILISLGLKAENYIISGSLNNIIIPQAYLPKCSYWNALQEIANAGLCKIFVDRIGRVIVTSDDVVSAHSSSIINSSNMFSAVSNISLTEFANEVKVEYSEIYLSDDIITAVETLVTLAPNEKLVLSLDYSIEISDAFIQSSNASIKIISYKSSVSAAEITVENISTSYQSAKITVTGYGITVNTISCRGRDEESIKQFGVTEYNHPTSELVQSIEHAQYIASRLLSKLHAGEGIVTTVWRGSPDLELGAEFDYTDRFGESKRLLCEYNKFTFDGGLKQETRGRKI